MAKETLGEKLRLEIVTPERIVVSEDVEEVVLPG
ncbi:MAG: F0F1 ATP synthase subunit epsilon, partial [bacterium]